MPPPGLEHVLGTRTKIRLLGALLPLDAPVSGREAQRRANVGSSSATASALAELTEAGILAREVEGRAHRYRVNPDHPLAEPLRRLYGARPDSESADAAHADGARAGAAPEPSADSHAEPRPPVLYVFSGLPGTGKTTLATRLARRLGAAYLRIDTVEQALRELCAVEIRDEGYRLSYRLAADNLRLGVTVVADSCNPIAQTRRAWERVADQAGAARVNIEVSCSDPGEHRRRVESRRSSIPGLRLPTWTQVLERAYEVWTGDALRIDTAGRSAAESFAELVSAVSESAGRHSSR